MKIMTQEEFDKWCSDLAQTLESDISVEDHGCDRVVYCNGAIISTKRIKGKLTPLPALTVFNALGEENLISIGKRDSFYNYELGVNEFGDRVQYEPETISIVSYPDEETEAWMRVAAFCGGREEIIDFYGRMEKYKEFRVMVRAENDEKYGYPRAEDVRK